MNVEIKKILIQFLDEIREYEHENMDSVYNDERESSEFVEIFLNSNPELLEEKKWKNYQKEKKHY